VYCITNTVTSEKYVGSSVNLYARTRAHRSTLRRGNHGNSHLQHSWNKYGEAAFIVTVLELCDRSVKIEREKFYVAQLDSLKSGFNMIPPGNEGPRRESSKKGTHLSEEQKLKISVTLTGRKANPEAIKRGAETRRKNGHAPNKGKKFSTEWRQHLGEGKKGKLKPEGFGERIKMRLMGIKKTPEHCQHLSESHKGKPSAHKGKIWMINPLTLETKYTAEFAELFNSGWLRYRKELANELAGTERLPSGMARCGKCNNVLSVKDFYVDKGRYTGVRTNCKSCDKQRKDELKRSHS
jgi:group I intron endonuclease